MTKANASRARVMAGSSPSASRAAPFPTPESPHPAEAGREACRDQEQPPESAGMIRGARRRRLVQELDGAGVVRDDEQADAGEEEPEARQPLREPRLGGPPGLPPHQAVVVAVGEVDRHPQDEPADEPPPR